MQVLEKILEEIEHEVMTNKEIGRKQQEGMARAMNIIRSHMDEVPDANASNKRLIDANALDEEVRNFFLAITGKPKQATVVRECKESFRRMIDEQPTVYADDNWIPVEERLPEANEIVVVTVHSSEWVSDFDTSFVPEEEKKIYPERYDVFEGCLRENREWVFFDESMSETSCEKEFGNDKGYIYSVVTAWQPLPEPYKPTEPKQTKNTQQELEDFWRDK